MRADVGADAWLDCCGLTYPADENDRFDRDRVDFGLIRFFPIRSGLVFEAF